MCDKRFLNGHLFFNEIDLKYSLKSQIQGKKFEGLFQ